MEISKDFIPQTTTYVASNGTRTERPTPDWVIENAHPVAEQALVGTVELVPNPPTKTTYISTSSPVQ